MCHGFHLQNERFSSTSLYNSRFLSSSVSQLCCSELLSMCDGVKQASGSGRARRDAAARAMQGWHSQRLLGNGEVSDPIIKVW